MIADYRKRKEAGLVEIRAHGDGIVTVILAQFDPMSGARMPDQFGQVNVQGFDAERAQAQRRFDEAKDFMDDLEAFIADATAAADGFGKEPTAKAATKEK